MRHHAIVIVLVCSVLGPASAQNASDTKGRSTVLALEHAWDQALGSGDIKALAAIFDDSLVYIDYDGKLLTKSDYLARVRSNATHLQQVVSEEMSVQMFGHTAIVVGTYHVRGAESGKPYLKHGRYTDTWILNGGNWICVAAATTPILR
ncbi:MAG: nuclear transport factor 2 family protein [Candidatus Sulfotelmatobacter sp.]